MIVNRFSPSSNLDRRIARVIYDIPPFQYDASAEKKKLTDPDKAKATVAEIYPWITEEVNSPIRFLLFIVVVIQFGITDLKGFWNWIAGVKE